MKELGKLNERSGVSPPYIVLSTTGSIARESTICFKRFDDAIAEKRKLPYSPIMVQILIALIRSAIRAI